MIITREALTETDCGLVYGDIIPFVAIQREICGSRSFRMITAIVTTHARNPYIGCCCKLEAGSHPHTRNIDLFCALLMVDAV